MTLFVCYEKLDMSQIEKGDGMYEVRVYNARNCTSTVRFQ
jgi:hypothetical protein